MKAEQTAAPPVRRSASWTCGRIFITGFCSIFIVVGCGVLYWTGKEAYSSIEPYFWSKSTCRVQSIEAVEETPSSGKYIIKVVFEFNADGKIAASRDFSRRPMTFSRYDEVYRYLSEYRPGQEVACYVSGNAAVLVLNSIFNLALPLFALPFIGFGLLGAAIGLFGRPVPDTGGINRPARGETLSRPGRKGKVLLTLFLSLFIAVGAGVMYALVLRPIYLTNQARHWPVVPASVLESRIIESDSDDGTSYSPFVLYSYTFESSEYQSNRYTFFEHSQGSSYQRASQIVEALAPGSQLLCRVNPQNPYQSVIDTSIPDALWLIAGIGLVFVLIPAAVMRFTLRQKKISEAPNQNAHLRTTFERPSVDRGLSRPGLNLESCDWFPRTGLQILKNIERLPSGEFVLTPLLSAKAKLGCALIGALIWNGVVCFLVFEDFSLILSGRVDWFSLLVSLPFIAAGLFLIGLVVYYALGTRNPRIRFFAPARTIRLGEAVRLRWEISGRVEALRSLSFELTAEEVAKYRRGTDTVTERNTFHKQMLWQTSGQMIVRSGQLELRLPDDKMHTFGSENNSVNWSLAVKGSIDNWPDLSEDFPLFVLPPGVTD